jgi:hypothetical protein
VPDPHGRVRPEQLDPVGDPQGRQAGPPTRISPYPSGPNTGPSARGSGTGPTRRARLTLTHVNPLSVTRITFAFSLCAFVILLVAVAVLWFVLDSVGVFSSVVDAADTLTDGDNASVHAWLSFSRAMQLTLLIGAINVILMTALATLGALLYNLCADMIGGVEVTLSD